MLYLLEGGEADGFCLVMNLSHIINEFSFGPYFPDITQPLDYSYELAQDRKLS